jgi:hypothetical protein
LLCLGAPSPPSSLSACFFGLANTEPKSWMYYKLKSAKIKCLLRFSIAIIRSKCKKNLHISLHGFKYFSQKWDLMKNVLLSYLACSQIWLSLPWGSFTFLSSVRHRVPWTPLWFLFSFLEIKFSLFSLELGSILCVLFFFKNNLKFFILGTLSSKY